MPLVFFLYGFWFSGWPPPDPSPDNSDALSPPGPTWILTLGFTFSVFSSSDKFNRPKPGGGVFVGGTGEFLSLNIHDCSLLPPRVNNLLTLVGILRLVVYSIYSPFYASKIAMISKIEFFKFSTRDLEFIENVSRTMNSKLKQTFWNSNFKENVLESRFQAN